MHYNQRKRLKLPERHTVSLGIFNLDLRKIYA